MCGLCYNREIEEPSFVTRASKNPASTLQIDRYRFYTHFLEEKMLIYNGLKADFMVDTENDVLETKLYNAIKNKMNRTTGLSELNSWRNSLREMYITLIDSNIPSDVGVAIEYNIPQTSKRVDFLISGYDKNNKGNVIIIELKQWEKLQAIEGQDAIVETYTGGANRRVVHPSYQAWSYAEPIKDYNEYVQDAEIELHPCAYVDIEMC